MPVLFVVRENSDLGRIKLANMITGTRIFLKRQCYFRRCKSIKTDGRKLSLRPDWDRARMKIKIQTVAPKGCRYFRAVIFYNYRSRTQLKFKGQSQSRNRKYAFMLWWSFSCFPTYLVIILRNSLHDLTKTFTEVSMTVLDLTSLLNCTTTILMDYRPLVAQCLPLADLYQFV